MNGDILAYVSYKYSNDEEGHKGFYRRIFEIYYDETDMRFNYRFIKSEEIEMPKDYKENYREVIGNIYDNPDLLKEE